MKHPHRGAPFPGARTRQIERIGLSMSDPKRQKVGSKEQVPTICVLGATGVGKGSTLNSCFQCDKFSTSCLFASDTIKPASLLLPWRGTGDMLRGVDLCGFSDSEGRDSGFIETMVAYLKEEVKFVSCFLLLLNSQEPRVGMHLKDMLMALKSVFGVPFMKNVMVGFTRFDYTKRGGIMRRGVTKEVRTARQSVDHWSLMLSHATSLSCWRIVRRRTAYTLPHHWIASGMCIAALLTCASSESVAPLLIICGSYCRRRWWQTSTGFCAACSATIMTVPVSFWTTRCTCCQQRS